MTKTALICGVSGQDGGYLAKLLLEKGYRVVGTSRDAQMSSFTNLKRLGVYDHTSLETMVPNDFRSVLQTLFKVRPHEVYNLAGQSSVGLSFQQPVETFESIATGTLNLLESIRFLSQPIRLFNAGSGECFGDTGGQAATEDSPFHPRSPYAVAKSAAHWEVASYRDAYGLFACTGILFNHESPLRPARFVTRKIVAEACEIANGRREKLHLGNLAIWRDWGWAPEYVDAMWRMLQQPHPNDFVVATGETCSLEAFTEAVFHEVGLDWREHVVTDESLLRPSDIREGRGDPTKAKRLLGWEAKYHIKDVVRLMVEAQRTGRLDLPGARR